jgi:hypothetical protein
VCWNSAERARPVRQVSPSQIVSRSEKNTQARDPIGCRASTKSRIRSRDGKRTVNRRFTRVSQFDTLENHINARDPNRARGISVGESGRKPNSVNGFGLTGQTDRGTDENDRSSQERATAPGAKHD